MNQWAVFVLVAGLVSSGCGGSDSNSGISPGDMDSGEDIASYTITFFDVLGTSDDLESGQAPIDPAENIGNFVLSWGVEESDNQHIISAYISQNEVLSNADFDFFGTICNGANACGRNNPFTIDCFFNSDNELYCAGDEDEAVDLTPFLDTLPKDAYVILESCSSSTLDCDSNSHPVQFR